MTFLARFEHQTSTHQQTAAKPWSLTGVPVKYTSTLFEVKTKLSWEERNGTGRLWEGVDLSGLAPVKPPPSFLQSPKLLSMLWRVLLGVSLTDFLASKLL